MEKPNLKYWANVTDNMADHEKYPSVSLYDKNMGYGLSCKVTPDGNIKLSTRAGGGHGEGTYDDCGHTAQEWADLIAEADEVRLHYWGN